MAHSIIVEERKKISVLDVAEVNGFSEKEIKISLVNGEKVLVLGQGMKIVGFSKESGNFVASGQISGVKYLGKSVSFIKKLIK